METDGETKTLPHRDADPTRLRPARTTEPSPSMTDAHAAVTHTHGDGTHDDDTLPIHEQTIQQVFAGLNPNGEKGLSSQRAAELLAEHGPNELDKPPRVSLLMLFVIQLNSVIMYLLMAAVVASVSNKYLR